MRVLPAMSFAFVVVAGLDSAWSAEPPAPKAVLVTGASTGIGHKITERLAADGYFVFATARKPEDLKRLGAMKNVQAVPLDVTHPEEISAAFDTIRKAGHGLYALVNNAGIGTAGTIADMRLEEYDLVMNVNAAGPVRMIKAFEPLIIEQKGRIINIGSISGILASQNLAAYSMSNHAIEALTDSLAGQLSPVGVRVSVVEPGNYNSDIVKSALARMGAESPAAHSPGSAIRADRSNYNEPMKWLRRSNMRWSSQSQSAATWWCRIKKRRRSPSANKSSSSCSSTRVSRMPMTARPSSRCWTRRWRKPDPKPTDSSALHPHERIHRHQIVVQVEHDP